MSLLNLLESFFNTKVWSTRSIPRSKQSGHRLACDAAAAAASAAAGVGEKGRGN